MNSGRLHALLTALQLERRIEADDKSVDSIRRAAEEHGVMKDRYLARSAAEILVATRAHGWEDMGRYLSYRAVSDRDPVGKLLRSSFRDAMLAEGIPRRVARMARRFYERPVPATANEKDILHGFESLLARLNKQIDLPTDGERVVAVPTIWEGWDAYVQLCDLYWETVANHRQAVAFDFADCRFLSPVGVAILGAITRSLQQSGRTVSFRWESFGRVGVSVNLKQNGFAHTFGQPTKPWTGNSVPFRQDREPNDRSIIGYLQDEWLRHSWIHLSPSLRHHVAGTVYEIYANAFEHSGSPIGALSCGQHYPNRATVSLTVVDLGIGIPQTVRKHLRRPQMKPSTTLRWAFERGNSTRAATLSRGLGLDLLNGFVHDNHGSLEIYSGDGVAHVGIGFQKRRSRLPAFIDLKGATFPGTIATITLNCDSAHFTPVEEAPQSVVDYF